MSKWSDDMDTISRISFNKDLSQKDKNKLIGRIETKMSRLEQREINGHKTGYYDDQLWK